MYCAQLIRTRFFQNIELNTPTLFAIASLKISLIMARVGNIRHTPSESLCTFRASRFEFASGESGTQALSR